MGSAEVRERTAELLETVGLTPGVGGRYAHQLSGGQRQRVMVALALACEPSLVIADEPTTALDVVMQAQVLQLLERLREQFGLALILISHDLGVLAETCDRIAVMYAGRIVEIGSVASVYTAPQHPYTKRLLASLPVIGGERGLAEAIPGGPPDPGAPPQGCRFHPRCPYAARALPDRPAAARGRPGPLRRLPLRALEGMARGRGVGLGGDRMSSADANLMEVRELEVQFRSRREVARAVDGVSIEWRRGEILGIVGESGCGKSTLARAILALVEPAAGDVVLNGDPVGDKSSLAELRKRVQMIFQDPYQTLNPRQRVRTIVAEPLRVQGVASDQHEERVERALNDVGLEPERFLERYPHQLSGGQRQRVAIAAALVLEPDGLICDEPVSMLDASVRAQILAVLLELQRRRGLGLIFITHDLSLAWSLCDRIAVMYLGRVVEQGLGGRRDRAPAAPLHAGAGHRDPGSRSGRRRRARAAQRRAPRPDRRPAGLPLPPPLPEAVRALRQRRPVR